MQVSKIFPIFAPKIEDNMEQQTDIRWIQRYANFHKACTRLLDVTEADRFMDDLSELEIEGTLSHVYDEEEVLPIVRLIYSNYAPLLKQLDESLAKLSQDQNYQQV